MMVIAVNIHWAAPYSVKALNRKTSRYGNGRWIQDSEGRSAVR